MFLPGISLSKSSGLEETPSNQWLGSGPGPFAHSKDFSIAD